ncbi:hypothetical protein [Marinobacter sp. OP 3.4]|uniref:hypothetical protein n=1 Tax=Marinobacter sp. OP 3.4 TaxID=3076501 RepID=UPI002E1C0444
MRWLLVLVLAFAMAGCGTTPEPIPTPEHMPAPVVCDLNQGITKPEPEPVRPTGDYTQRHVSDYVARLHRWGSRGWEKLASARQRNERCKEKHEPNTAESEGEDQ